MNTPISPLPPRLRGLRQYALDREPRLLFASRSLCSLLGVPADRLTDGDGYASFVHPEDRPAYHALLQRMAAAPCRDSLCYRLVCADGSVLPVCDTLTSWQEKAGQMRAEAELSPRTPEEQAPWGFLRCTCEKQPRITYLNHRMRQLLRLPAARRGEADYLELYRENIFLMLPMEERRRFARYLERIRAEDIPVFGETTLLRCDGTRAHVFGWVTRGRSSSGEEEFQAVCLDITQHYQTRKELAARRYLSALKDVYDKIFQYDLGEGIVKCLHDSKEARFRWLQDLPMQMEQTTEKWVSETVIPAEQPRVLEFFRDYYHNRAHASDAAPSRITYQARSSSGEICSYTGIFLKMDDNISLYCCRRLPDLREADQLRNENDSLRENMQELMQFTDGIAAFQISGDTVTPLYVTDNICKFFGRSREEWLPMMKKATPIRDFVSHSAVDYEKFEALLRNGEAEFTYFDLESNKEQRMKAICSHKSPREGVPRYVMLYNVEPERAETPHVYLRTFGFFDVFVDETPIAFRNRKSKELLALLADRRGGFVTSEEAITYLWEDEPVSPVTLARYRKVALRLKNSLMEYGISDVVEAVDGKRRIIPQKVRCDLYDYLSGQEEFSQLFKGSYLSNYSWGEITLAELSGREPV